jgi:hypothetical protein
MHINTGIAYIYRVDTVSDILAYIKRGAPLPKKKKRSKNTWKFSKRKPYVVLLNKELVAEVDNIARQLGISRSALIEKILYELVEQWRNYGKTNPSPDRLLGTTQPSNH